jgi:hypothetical protein
MWTGILKAICTQPKSGFRIPRAGNKALLSGDRHNKPVQSRAMLRTTDKMHQQNSSITNTIEAWTYKLGKTNHAHG